MVPRTVDPPRRANKRNPRDPLQDRRGLCHRDCGRVADQCPCLLGMLEDRGIEGARIIYFPPGEALPGAKNCAPHSAPSRALLPIAFAIGFAAGAILSFAWWRP